MIALAKQVPGIVPDKHPGRTPDHSPTYINQQLTRPGECRGMSKRTIQ